MKQRSNILTCPVAQKSTSFFLISIRCILLIFPVLMLNGCFNSDEPILNKAYQKFDLGYYESAIKDFNDLIKKYPDDYEAYLYRGISYSNLGDTVNAKADFINACNIFKASLFTDKNIDYKIKILCKSLNELGWMSLDHKDTSSALTYFNEAKYYYESNGSKKKFYSPQIYYALGKINYGFMKSNIYKDSAYIGFRDEAMKNFTNAIEEDKYYEWGFFGKGLIHYSDGYYDSAYNDVNMAIILNNKFSWAYYFRALCEKKLNGNADKICSDFKKSIKYQEKGDEVIDSAGLGEGCR